MKTKYISIFGINDLVNFCSKANEVEGDVLVSKGKFVVDGKSMMGLMSIDVSSGCKIEYPEDAEDFETFIENFSIKG